MDIIEFSVDGGLFPLYRSISPDEVRLLQGLLGEGFTFSLSEGDPVDRLAFDLLLARAVDSWFFFTPPPAARLIGTIQLQGAPVGVATTAGKRPRLH